MVFAPLCGVTCSVGPVGPTSAVYPDSIIPQAVRIACSFGAVAPNSVVYPDSILFLGQSGLHTRSVRLLRTPWFILTLLFLGQSGLHTRSVRLLRTPCANYTDNGVCPALRGNMLSRSSRSDFRVLFWLSYSM